MWKSQDCGYLRELVVLTIRSRERNECSNTYLVVLSLISSLAHSSGCPCLGNGATHSGLGFSISIKESS